MRFPVAPLWEGETRGAHGKGRRAHTGKYKEAASGIGCLRAPVDNGKPESIGAQQVDNFKNAAIRGIRTYLQVFVALLLAGWVEFTEVGEFLDLAQSAALAAAPALLSFVQNALEDNTDIDVPKG
jgi:hypothetical protein